MIQWLSETPHDVLHRRAYNLVMDEAIRLYHIPCSERPQSIVIFLVDLAEKIRDL